MSMTYATFGRAIGLCAALTASTLAAAAQTAWSVVEGEARATLPAPQPGSPFTGGSMSCAGQVWTLSLTVEPGTEIAGTTGTALLAVPRGTFSASSATVPAGAEIKVPHIALEPMMASNWLTVTFESGDSESRFSLAGSRRAITAVDGLCTPREMPLFNSVALTSYSSYLELARKLRSEDIRDFTVSTAMSPDLRAGMVEIDAGRRLLFAELCGSTWYYGISGCGLAGFAPVPDADPQTPEGWRLVYESEGVFLYVDPKTTIGGWPVLVSLPKKAGDEETRWVWTGNAYAAQEAAVAAPAETPDEEGSGSD